LTGPHVALQLGELGPIEIGADEVELAVIPAGMVRFILEHTQRARHAAELLIETGPRQNLCVVPPQTLSDAGVSEREAEVLALLAQRATNAEIAARLYVSVRTVESHVSSLLRKLRASDRRQLAQLATGLRADDDRGSATTAAPVAPGVPAPLTSFVGRAREVAELIRAVTEHRLVTATGPGGVGKTRLATRVAAELWHSRANGVWFVDLVPVSDPSLIPAAVAAALGVHDPRGRTIDDAVLAHLAERDVLLVLDNCEHVSDAVAVFVERLLGHCAGVTVLATSRARLMLPFEWVLPVPGLSLAGDGGEGDAVALFVERARQVGVTELSDDDRRRIGEIVRGLDGMALAIELAAARVPTLGLDGLERGLAEQFRLLTGASRLNERHGSLRSTIDWSYDLLAPDDQALLRRVAVFAAPFAAADAAAVTAFPPIESQAVPDGLARLADHSLLLASRGAETRYRLLETIRQYGVERMDDDSELGPARRRHLQWCMETVDALRDGAGDQRDLEGWRSAFDRAADDLRAALAWASRQDDLRPDAGRLALGLAGAAFTRGLVAESQRRYEQSADLADEPRGRVTALQLAAGAAASRHGGNDALRLWRTAAAAAIDAGDTGSAAYALAHAALLANRLPGIIADQPPPGTADQLLAEARPLAVDAPGAATAMLLAETFDRRETDPEMRVMAERAAAEARQLGDRLLESAALDALSVVHLASGNVPGALAAVGRRIDLLATLRPGADNGIEISDAYAMASEIALTAGDLMSARRYADTLAALPYHFEEGHLATARRMKVDALAGEVDRVLTDAEQFRRGWEQAGRPRSRNVAGGSLAVAMIHGLRGDDSARAEWYDITVALGADVEFLDSCGSGYAPTFDAIVLLHRGDADGALARLADNPADFTHWHNGEWRPWYAALWAEAAVLAAHASGDERIEQARHIAAPNPIAAAMVERAAALMARDTEALVRRAETLDAAGCRYQWARTLVLAGSDHGQRGRAALGALGVAPMAEPW
jgi:predicted ATPase/DNA-binding CsgD family transcriptional regulator